jgi:uncharacterized protein YegP (UPF0339 family)
MAGQFEIYRDQGGRYRFCLRGRNGEIVAASEAYPTAADAKRGVKEAQRAAADAKVVDLTTSDG